MDGIRFLACFVLLLFPGAGGCRARTQATPGGVREHGAAWATSGGANGGASHATNRADATLYLPSALAVDFPDLVHRLGKDSAWRIEPEAGAAGEAVPDSLETWRRNLAGECTQAQAESWRRAVIRLSQGQADAFLWAGPPVVDAPKLGRQPPGLEQRLVAREALSVWAPVLEGPMTLTAGEAREALGEPGAITFLPAGRLPSAAAPLRPVRIDGLLPTTTAVADGRYPLTRPLLLVGRRPLDEKAVDVLAHALAEELQPPAVVVRLSALGDVMLARGVTGRMKRMGAGYPFALTADRLQAADLTLSWPTTGARSTETSLTTSTSSWRMPLWRLAPTWSLARILMPSRGSSSTRGS